MHLQEISQESTTVEDLLVHPDPWHIPYEEVQGLQLRLLQQRFAENRDRIPILKRAADRQGIHAIGQISDVIPLLFSHRTYKSYPESFLENGQWGRMNQWVSSLTVRGDELHSMDVSQVDTLDEWLALLDTHGFALCHSSGSSGKPSFLPKSAEEQEMMGQAYCASLLHGQGVNPVTSKMPVLCVGFRSGWGVVIRRNHNLARAFAPIPDAIEFAFPETQSPAALRYELQMKRRIAEGRVSISEQTVFLQAMKAKQEQASQAFQTFAERILSYNGQRVLLLGHTVTVYSLTRAFQAMGVERVFASNSVSVHGGGSKGAAIPSDYQSIMERYLGISPGTNVEVYGMSERNSFPLVCEHGRKHCSPWEVLLLLDHEGQRLINPPFGSGGIVTGRYAFVDLIAATYWGGFTTGDQVSVCFSRCPCGRTGPQILKIARYQDLQDAPDEDKLSCAAEMAGYVQAVLDEQGEV